MEERRGLLRSLYLTIFLISTAYGTITFLLPVYAESLGATYIELGLLGSIGSVVYTVMTLITGLMLDRFEKVRFFLVFTAFGAIVPVLFSLTSRVPELFALRGLLGVASAAFWVTASTLTADLSPPEELTKSVVRYNVSWISGFVAGPILGGIVSDRYGFPALFVLVATLILPSVLLIATRLRGRVTFRVVSGGIWKGFTSLRPIALAYITIIPYAIVLGIYMAILPGHMGVLGISASAIGLLLTMTNAVRGLGFLSSERWVRWGTRRSLWISSKARMVIMNSSRRPACSSPSTPSASSCSSVRSYAKAAMPSTVRVCLSNCGSTVSSRTIELLQLNPSTQVPREQP